VVLVMMNSGGRNYQFYDIRRMLDRIESSIR
jgi:hypothetical protein